MTQCRVWQFALLLPAFGTLVGCGDSGPSGSAKWVGKTFLLDTPALSPQPAAWQRPAQMTPAPAPTAAPAAAGFAANRRRMRWAVAI